MQGTDEGTLTGEREKEILAALFRMDMGGGRKERKEMKEKKRGETAKWDRATV